VKSFQVQFVPLAQCVPAINPTLLFAFFSGGVYPAPLIPRGLIPCGAWLPIPVDLWYKKETFEGGVLYG
jgi:hypothetical protein